MSAILDFLKELKKYKFFGGALFGLILSGIILGFTLDYKFNDFIFFLGHKKEFAQGQNSTQILFKNYIKSNKENLLPFFYNSKENQKALLPIITKSNIPAKVVSKVFDISNREIDKFRIVNKINTFALTEFDSSRFDDDTQDLIDDLFMAFKLILNNKKRDYEDAARLLKTCYENISEESEEIRLETLRYLTFCYFVTDNKKNAVFLLDHSKNLKQKYNLSYTSYISNYFWIDLLDLWISITNDDIKNANLAFNNLFHYADPEFAELKLLQHELRLSGDNLELWRKFISNIREINENRL